jgi:hypothetical protein
VQVYPSGHGATANISLRENVALFGERTSMLKEYVVGGLGIALGCLSYITFKPFADHLKGKLLFALSMPALIAIVGTASSPGDGPAMIPARFITWVIPVMIATVALHYMDQLRSR